jgi:nucleotide-binding universal stress UspA family protein
MSAPHTILVPTDFSDAAESALDVALQLAATLRAKVYVMHVVGSCARSWAASRRACSAPRSGP